MTAAAPLGRLLDDDDDAFVDHADLELVDVGLEVGDESPMGGDVGLEVGDEPPMGGVLEAGPSVEIAAPVEAPVSGQPYLATPVEASVSTPRTVAIEPTSR